MGSERYVKISYFGYTGFELDGQFKRQERVAKLPVKFNPDFLNKERVVFAQSKEDTAFRTALVTSLTVTKAEIALATENDEMQKIYVIPRESKEYINLLKQLALQNGRGRQVPLT